MEENEKVKRRRWVCDGGKSEKEESCLKRKKKIKQRVTLV